ncbi:hypothetical protein [Faecalispora sporosphaeroides]|uniref:Uncharacterized protein n=1 Tax=Faecalispora sporosphaeroides TaxID=1549 RepID=A0A928KTG6_9FIRM|nr:hypothetical protein [Faecalispora sporosphaeroides]MBE6834353.1 hypothetical protein [Faecalispora sporosphaeroides]
MPFLCNGDFSVHSKIINGVQYVTFSFFKGESTIFDKVGKLITHSCEATEEVEVSSESLVDNGIAIKDD